MPIAVLLTNPAAPTLDPAAAEALRNAWGGDDLVWLAPDIACEFSLPRIPENRWTVWQEMQALGVDLCIVPEENRRKKMLIADMDSTMIGQECIDELADAAGVGDRVKEITARAMNGELDFEGALRERVRLLAGLPVATIDEVLAARITDAPGAATLVATMRKFEAYTLLVSGGFTAFSGPVSQRLGFHDHRANTLTMEEKFLSGSVAEPILGRAAKVDALQETTARLGIAAQDVVAVGDGANDLGMLHAAGMGVALHAKPAVAAEVDLRVNHGDLTALLYLQGISSADFA